MKNISRQDRYLYEQVETVLRDSIPDISKNIHESLLDRLRLFAKEKYNAAKVGILKRYAKSASRSQATQRKNVEDIKYRRMGMELGLKPEHIRTIMTTYPSTHPGLAPQPYYETEDLTRPPDPVTGARPKIKVATPNYEAELKTHREKLEDYKERQKLIARMRGAVAHNPFIGATLKQGYGETRVHGQIESASNRAVKQAQQATEQARQERIRKGYIKP